MTWTERAIMALMFGNLYGIVAPTVLKDSTVMGVLCYISSVIWWILAIWALAVAI